METQQEIKEYYKQQLDKAIQCHKLATDIKKNIPELFNGLGFKIDVQKTWDKPTVQICNHENCGRINFKKATLLLHEFFKKQPQIETMDEYCSDEKMWYDANLTVDEIDINLRATNVTGCTIKKVTKKIETFESNCLQELNGQTV